MKGRSKKEVQEAKDYLKAMKALSDPEFAESLSSKKTPVESVL